MFRKTFNFQGSKDMLHWFPFHMQHGIKLMQAKLKTIDAIIEVHDARIPFSGRSKVLQDSMRARPYLLLLNKADRADLSRQEEVTQILHKSGVSDVMFTTCNKHRSNSVRKIVPRLVEIINTSNRYRRTFSDVYRVMVVGLPNTGKSTVINSLRHLHLGLSGDAVKVGNAPGVTRAVQNRVKICTAPQIYLVDTPGIFEPHVRDVETGLKLALCNVLADHRLGYIHMADYALYWMNKTRKFDYVSLLGLKEPVDKMEELLQIVAALKDWTRIYKYPGAGKDERREILDIEKAARFVVQEFRSSGFGKVMLDDDLLP